MSSFLYPCDRLPRAVIRFGFRFVAALPLLFFLFALMGADCRAQSRDVVCREGTGEFQGVSASGISVHVAAERNLELAARACDATIQWGDQTLVVATAAAELDLDAFGADLGLDVPVAAFQVKKSKTDCCMEYRIYSLKTPPVLLRTITGGDFFSAGDTDLDGRVELWTDDAAAVDGFENLRLGELDFAPPLVLRFARGRLLNASSEFQPYYDQKIADLRAKLDPQTLAEFKRSDGRTAPLPAVPPGQVRQPSPMRIAKARVLEIFWSYLYSGREQEAWRSLAEMWPAEDHDRIRAALQAARSRGILSQVDGVSVPVSPSRQLHAKIFDGTITVTPTPGVTPRGVKPKPEITPPKAILMEREPPSDVYEAEMARTESILKLIIDCAGKVRSVEVLGTPQTVDDGLVKSTVNWKFIPAFSQGEPVASQILLGVSLKR